MDTDLPGGPFAALDPLGVIPSLEVSYGLRLQDSLSPCTSYVNRVWSLRDEEGGHWIAKFYRPGRWTEAQIREEHRFMADCGKADLPVVLPVPDRNGDTLARLDSGGISFFHALFPRRAGRTFDAEGDDDWLRLGRLASRLHLAGQSGRATGRDRCHPVHTTTAQLQHLWDSQAVHSDIRNEFFDIAEAMLDRISPLFDGVDTLRIHGDLHRGNILDRGPEGLLLMDFDDMMTGPAVQDLWLMLPGRRDEASRELGLLLAGYTEYRDFDHSTLDLVEPLRFMRMVHHLDWVARQRLDAGFDTHFPGWGSRSFWIRETEDIRTQERFL